ncbi:hypothetical protein ACFV9C_42045 [Kribbella sp. NPDC059898]|uniref:hypothetical protein n=1 Tax=Kribbella sp. NPDC059898 TaxID=3346995 RepID=UPI003648B2F8
MASKKHSWTAAGAARTAREARVATAAFLRDAEVARLWQGGRFMEEHQVKTHAVGDSDSAALLLTTGLGYTEDWRPNDWVEVADTVLGDLTETMTAADLYVLSPAMRDVVVAAALSLTIDDIALLTQEDLPALKGLLVLPEPLIVTTAKGQLGDDLAYMWDGTAGLSMVDEHQRGRFRRLAWTRVPAVQVTSFSDSYGPIQPDSFRDFASYAELQGTPVPPLMLDGIRCTRYDWTPTGDQRAAIEDHRRAAQAVNASSRAMADAVGWDEDNVEADYVPGSEITDVDGLFSIKFLYAFWRLCAQRITDISDAPVKNATRAAAERAGTSPEVRVTHLRTSARGGNDPETGATWNHRWVVRMHKVRQWYPSEQRHKVLYRGPYIKGPEDKPLLGGEVVRHLG